MNYQTEEEELAILEQELGSNGSSDYRKKSLAIIRATRDHAAIKRGASVRAAIAIGKLVSGGIAFEEACHMALPSRIELSSSDTDPREIIQNLIQDPASSPQKKKDLTPHKVASTSEREVGRSFFPPELASQAEEEAFDGGGLGNQTKQMRKLFLRRGRSSKPGEKLDLNLVAMVMDHARSIISHPTRPTERRLRAFRQNPFGELALEESLELSPWLDSDSDLMVEETVPKRFPCVAMLDCSFSMAGDKHLLSSVAVAVLMLEVAAEDTALVVFGSHAKTVKRLNQQTPPEKTVLDFLKVQPKGFTNIAKGLHMGLDQIHSARTGRRRVGILATDGRTTEGEDPFEVAKKYDHLVVLHLNGPGSHLEASQQLARAGKGDCLEVERFEELPRRLYDALRSLSRL